MPAFTREMKTFARESGPNILRSLLRLARSSDGAIMIEALIGVLLLSTVGVAVLSGLSTTHISGANTERQSVAENIARNQMEYVFDQPYQEPPPPSASYPLISLDVYPDSYDLTCDILEYLPGDDDIEKVVVTVTFDGEELLVLETLRSRV